jgi:rubrerythrin
MAILTPTKDKGATAKPVGLLYVEPELQMTDDDLSGFMAGSGLNGAFMADLMSGVLTHERCGVHLYRSVSGRTNNPVLGEKYEEFGRETERHVEILEALIAQAGGNPNYVSPNARAVEGTDAKVLESTFMLSGSVDLMTAEMAMLDAVFLAESIDHANWKLLGVITEQLPEGDLRAAFQAAVDEVEDQEDEHLTWAKTTKERLVMLEASNDIVMHAGAKAEELVSRVRSWFKS